MKVYWNGYESTQTRHESTECGCETTVGKKRLDGLDLSHELGLKCPFTRARKFLKLRSAQGLFQTLLIDSFKKSLEVNAKIYIIIHKKAFMRVTKIFLSKEIVDVAIYFEN